MLLSEILKGLHYTADNPSGKDPCISGITADSRSVRPGFLFICVKGLTSDGHDYIAQAAENGAAAVLCEFIPDKFDKDIVFAVTEDSRTALPKAASNFFGHPEKELKIIGVTGTKGKTSVTYYIEAILRAAGKKAGIIGTTGVYLDDMELPASFKTSSMPDIIDLYEILRRLADNGAEYAVMEASSHGLDQGRAAGIEFCAGVFTNLTRDHLDYHKTMEQYAEAKALLFKQCRIGIINADDSYARTMCHNAACSIKTFSIENHSDYRAGDISGLAPEPSSGLEVSSGLGLGVRFSLDVDGKKYYFSLPVPGRFSVYNALAAVSTALELGIPPRTVLDGLAKAKGARGRLESVPNNNGFTVIVDYAHTPDSLANVLKTAREFTSGKVIALFGCGGNRDKGKRPLMGECAGQLSDLCVITSDNPRDEKPEDIINQVLEGVKKTNCRYIVCVDRKEAILTAIGVAKPGDCVILAGKGHETYQEFENHRKIHFDDSETAAEALRSLL